MSTRRVNGAAVKAIRLALGVSGADLARRAILSDGHLFNIERGIRQPGPELVERIANEMGVPVEAITYEVPECPTCKAEVAA